MNEFYRRIRRIIKKRWFWLDEKKNTRHGFFFFGSFSITNNKLYDAAGVRCVGFTFNSAWRGLIVRFELH